MISLIAILKELADSSKSFPFKRTGKTISKDEEGVYMKGNMYYNFVTDNSIKYEVNIFYLPSYDEVYDYLSDTDGQMVEVSFYQDTNSSMDEAVFGLTNNPSEIFKVMNTIVKCIAAAKDDEDFKYILYQPSEDKNHGKSVKGSEQRKKLFDQYIKREFPNSTLMTKNKYTVAILDK